MTGQKGFTLIEMVVSLVLLGLLMAVLASSLRTSGKAWNAGDARAEGWLRTQAAQSLLRDQIEMAMPLAEGTAEQPRIRFEGGHDRLHLAAPTEPPLAPGGFHDLRLSVEGGDLMVDWTPTVGVPGQRRVLVEHVAAVELSYYGGSPATWRRSWNEPVLPRLVQVELRFAPGDSREWPPLVVAPRLDRRAYCAQRVAPPFCQDRRQGKGQS